MIASPKKAFYKKWHGRILHAYARVWVRHSVGGLAWLGFRSGWAAGYRAGGYDQRKRTQRKGLE